MSVVRLSPSALAKAGKITPPYQPSGFDRAAFYTMDGKYYDVHARLIEPGVPLDPDAEEVEAEDASPVHSGTEGDPPIGTLIALAPTMPMAELRLAAERFLGENVHRSRQQIINQLKTLKNTGPHIDWADFERGGPRTNLVQVRRFIAARFGKIVTSRRQALALLRDYGVIGMPPKKSGATTAGPPPANEDDV